jgi:putative endonuclease
VRTPAQRLGDAAETFAADRLIAEGWEILARQLRVGRAEIDLITVDPGPPRSLVFVEVRWRARRDFGLAEETVGHAKRARLHAAAFALVDGTRTGPTLPRLPVRFDLIVVEPGGRMRHHRHGA